MSKHDVLRPPVTPRVFQYLAVPAGDRGLAEAASCCQANLRWAPQDRDKATHKDWQAYQNLLQLTGIISTASLGNARKGWEHVVEFVEMNDMAQRELPPTKVEKGSFTTAQQLLNTEQESRQSPSPAYATTAEPCAGELAGGSSQKPPLSPAQISRITANREQALARKQAKMQNECVETANASAALPLADPRSEQSARSHI